MQEPNKRPCCQIGTPQCGVVCSLIGIALAFMFLYVGFWGTLFVTALAVLGYWFGASTGKLDKLKTLINKLFPPKGE